jgi:hypothetical protein
MERLLEENKGTILLLCAILCPQTFPEHFGSVKWAKPAKYFPPALTEAANGGG